MAETESFTLKYIACANKLCYNQKGRAQVDKHNISSLKNSQQVKYFSIRK